MALVPYVRKARALLTGFVAVGVMLPVLPAAADPPDWAHAHGWRGHHRVEEEVIVVRPAPAYVVPAPQPVVYVQPQPVYVVPQPAPIYAVPPPPPPPPQPSVACGGSHTNEVVGVLAGAAGGGLIGSQFGKGTGKLATTGAGVAAGALLGDQVGRSLDTPC